MRYRLGESETMLSPIGMGTWQFSQGRGLAGKFWPNLPPSLIQAIVGRALDYGINWFDTAEIYGQGQSEESLATALDATANNRQALIATKWWPVFRSSHSLRQSADERLRHLHHRPITLYQIHQPYARSSIASQMRVMAELLDQGVIAHAGVSNFSLPQMLEAHRALKSHGHPLVSNQVRYHLLDRRIEQNGLLSAAKDLGITIIAYSPLAQGLLTGKFHDDHTRPSGVRRLDPRFGRGHLRRTKPLIDLLNHLGKRYQVTPAQVALNWIITTPGRCLMAIPGATHPRQAQANAEAMGWSLSASDREALCEMAPLAVNSPPRTS